MLRFIAVMVFGVVAVGAVFAGAEKVAFPEGYQSHFVRYSTIDNEKRKKVRFFYVNPESLENARAGRPLPNGTVLIMEDRKAKLGADGTLLKDKRGRFIPTAEILNIFVQEKRAGWGAEYDDTKRNGEWEYAWFDANGQRPTGKTFDRCFACHKERAESDDFNFTFSKFVGRMKK